MGKRLASDEYYVIGLCDEVLGKTAQRQAKFDFLRGDKGHRLAVDAYYPELALVIEYQERQHRSAVPLWDQRMTISGMPRGEQRLRYDGFRRTKLPANGIRLIEIGCSELTHRRSGKLLRDRTSDLALLKEILAGI